MDDVVTRCGKNADIVLGTIAATLIAPPVAVAAALFAILYASGKISSPSIRGNYKVPNSVVYDFAGSYVIRKSAYYGRSQHQAYKA